MRQIKPRSGGVFLGNQMLKVFAFLVFSTSAQAETFTGNIFHVADGDAVTLLVQKQEIQIRVPGSLSDQKRRKLYL
jgi:endonuclease YncB( thermonuclease family)